MVKKLSILLLLLFLIQPTSFARAVGCRIGLTTIYTNQYPSGLLNTGILGGTPLYYSNSGTFVDSQCISDTGNQCRICPGGVTSFLGLIVGCSGGFVYGVEANYILNCNLDSHHLLLLLLGGSSGLWFLTKKPK